MSGLGMSVVQAGYLLQILKIRLSKIFLSCFYIGRDVCYSCTTKHRLEHKQLYGGSHVSLIWPPVISC